MGVINEALSNDQIFSCLPCGLEIKINISRRTGLIQLYLFFSLLPFNKVMFLLQIIN